MSAVDFRPLSIAKGEGFQVLAQMLIDIGAKHGSVDVKTLFNDPTTYSRSVLPSMASDVRETISKSLRAQFSSMPSFVSPACFVGDHWTDKYRSIEFTSIAVSFVDTEFVLRSYDLCVSEYDGASKHAINIKNDIMLKLESYIGRSVLQKTDGRFVFVSDSDAKLVAALRDDFDRQSCAVHDLSLCVKAALKSAESNAVGIMIDDSKILVRHFKKSGLNRSLSSTLKQDVATRFNSVYTMLVSIDNMYDEVTALLTSSDDLSYISNIKRKTLKSVCKELKRFDEATKKLAAEKVETLHLVVPVLHELKSKMRQRSDKYAEQGEAEVSKLCSDLARLVDDKCLRKLTWYHFAAVVLYPEFRNHPGVQSMEAEVDRVQLDLHGMLGKMTSGGSLETEHKQKSKLVLIDSDSDSDSEPGVDGSGADLVSASGNGDEFDAFCRMTFDYDNIDSKTPLQFWKDNANRFPKLSVIARSVFSIPASQNKSERAFSAAAHVMTDLRTTLDPEHLDELLLIRSHYRQSQ